MLATHLKNVFSHFDAQLKQHKNVDVIQSAYDKIVIRELLSFNEYEKLIGFLSSLIAGEKDTEKEVMLRSTKEQLQLQGNSLVEECFIKPDGRMPNASLMLGFVDADTDVRYVILIQNSNFNQFTTPAGKINKDDVVVDSGRINTEKTYQVAAIRKLCEEALTTEGASTLMTFMHSKKLAVQVIDRNAFGIPEINTDYDTRLFTLDIGKQRRADVQRWLAAPHAHHGVEEVFIQPVSSLTYKALSAEPAGKLTNYFLTHTDVAQHAIRLPVRATALIVLNGPTDKPELGFGNVIGNEAAGSSYQYSKQQTLLPPRNQPQHAATTNASSKQPARGQQQGR